MTLSLKNAHLHELGLLELVARTVALGAATSGHHVPELAVVDCLALAWLRERELRDFPRLSVNKKLHSLVQLSGSDYFAHFLAPVSFNG